MLSFISLISLLKYFHSFTDALVQYPSNPATSKGSGRGTKVSLLRKVNDLSIVIIDS